jgi:hypothetical protein
MILLAIMTMGIIAPSLCAGIIFNSQNRYVQNGLRFPTIPPDINQPPIVAPDFGPFVVGTLAEATSMNATYYQSSTIGPTSLDATVRVSEGYTTSPIAYPWGISQYEVTFTLSDPTPYTLTTTLKVPGVSNFLPGTVKLTSPTNQVQSFTVTSSLSTFTGTLTPGQWKFNATALGDQASGIGPNEYSVVTSLQLPEPASLSIVAGSGALLLRRRRRTEGVV